MRYRKQGKARAKSVPPPEAFFSSKGPRQEGRQASKCKGKEGKCQEGKVKAGMRGKCVCKGPLGEAGEKLQPSPAQL